MCMLMLQNPPSSIIYHFIEDKTQFRIQTKNHPNNKKKKKEEKNACVCVCRIKNSPKRNKTNECKAKESEIISYSIRINLTLKK